MCSRIEKFTKTGVNWRSCARGAITLLLKLLYSKVLTRYADTDMYTTYAWILDYLFIILESNLYRVKS